MDYNCHDTGVKMDIHRCSVVKGCVYSQVKICSPMTQMPKHSANLPVSKNNFTE